MVLHSIGVDAGGLIFFVYVSIISCIHILLRCLGVKVAYGLGLNRHMSGRLTK
jgi:hypothetical protein